MPEKTDYQKNFTTAEIAGYEVVFSNILGIPLSVTNDKVWKLGLGNVVQPKPDAIPGNPPYGMIDEILVSANSILLSVGFTYEFPGGGRCCCTRAISLDQLKLPTD
jgi:hypothetical protein